MSHSWAVTPNPWLQLIWLCSALAKPEINPCLPFLKSTKHRNKGLNDSRKQTPLQYILPTSRSGWMPRWCNLMDLIGHLPPALLYSWPILFALCSLLCGFAFFFSTCIFILLIHWGWLEEDLTFDNLSTKHHIVKIFANSSIIHTGKDILSLWTANMLISRENMGPEGWYICCLIPRWLNPELHLAAPRVYFLAFVLAENKAPPMISEEQQNYWVTSCFFPICKGSSTLSCPGAGQSWAWPISWQKGFIAVDLPRTRSQTKFTRRNAHSC